MINVKAPNLKAWGASALIGFAVVGSAIAANEPMVGGAPMYANKNIIQNAVNSKDHTTLVAAVKAGGLVDTLKGRAVHGIRPDQCRFRSAARRHGRHAAEAREQGDADKVLTYHVVPGRLDTKELDQQIMHGGGHASLKTVEGDTLTVTGSGKKLSVTDAKGNTAKVTIADVYQSNGVILVVDKVLMPN